jgi:hypothetical protein
MWRGRRRVHIHRRNGGIRGCNPGRLVAVARRRAVRRRRAPGAGAPAGGQALRIDAASVARVLPRRTAQPWGRRTSAVPGPGRRNGAAVGGAGRACRPGDGAHRGAGDTAGGGWSARAAPGPRATARRRAARRGVDGRPALASCPAALARGRAAVQLGRDVELGARLYEREREHHCDRSHCEHVGLSNRFLAPPRTAAT